MSEDAVAGREHFVATTERMLERGHQVPRDPARPGSGDGPGAVETLLDIASTLRAQLPGQGVGAAGSAGGLGQRIDARRAQVVGARGPVSAARIKTALRRGGSGPTVPTSTADLPSRQQLLAQRVVPAATAAKAVVDALVPSRLGRVDPAEVSAVLTALSGVVTALRTEAVERDPRRELVEAKAQELDRLFDRLSDLMLPRRDRDDHFTSREDLEQRNRLRLLEHHLTTVASAYAEFFELADQSVPAADRVVDVQDGLRVVGDGQVELRHRLYAVGLGDAELAAPEARLSWIDDDLPRMTMARLLDWVAELAGGRDAADLPTTGAVGLRSVAEEATVLADLVRRVVAATGGPDDDTGPEGGGDVVVVEQDGAAEGVVVVEQDGAVEAVVVVEEAADGDDPFAGDDGGEPDRPEPVDDGAGGRRVPLAVALADARVRQALRGLQAQLAIVAETAGGNR